MIRGTDVNVLLSGLSVGCIYALIGICFNITYATTSIFNFAQGEFVMVGAMVGVALVATAGLPLLVALVVAVAVAALLGALEERLAVRRTIGPSSEDHVWLLSTLGVSIILSSGFAIVMGSDIRQFPRIFSEVPTRIGDVLLIPQQLAIVVLALAVTIGLTLFYSRASVGQAMRAISQDRDAAAVRGIPVSALAMVSFALSGGIAALTGFMIAPLTTAYAGMGALFLFKGFIAAAIGGFPSIKGALIGGVFLGVVEAFAVRTIGAGYRETVTFVVLLVLLLVKPRGLLGSKAALRAV